MAQPSAFQQPSGSKNKIEKVAIVGATGTIGQYITSVLLKTGSHTITALTRIGSSTNRFLPGINIAKVNYNDEASIHPPDTQSRLIRAAAKAGVKWIMPNEYSPPFADNEALGRAIGFYERFVSTRKQIEKAGLAWTSLQCGFWCEVSLSGSPTRCGFDFAEKSITFFDDGEAKINHSTWPQCARAVAAFLSLPVMPEDENETPPTMSRWRNKALPISSFLLSQRDMLDSVLNVTGEKESEWMITHVPSEQRFEQAREEMKAGLMDAYVVAMYTRTFYPDGCGVYDKDGGLANEVLGLPREDLEECTNGAVRMAATGEAGYKLAGEVH
ncbi:NAD(P)-binding protein [Teratosphaeria nubilosa]|uniref:NAD(P)-binding protein n=1 Tax=Teratosphaeria nubilosa TaxID=161662 RepID=A0A6G1LCD7_9PEZI|nr:NAD(P)-binding protein [Teratosphaeria nubilosa]